MGVTFLGETLRRNFLADVRELFFPFSFRWCIKTIQKCRHGRIRKNWILAIKQTRKYRFGLSLPAGWHAMMMMSDIGLYTCTSSPCEGLTVTVTVPDCDVIDRWWSTGVVSDYQMRM